MAVLPRLTLFLVFAWMLMPTVAQGQVSSLIYSAAVEAMGGSETALPFWLVTNRYGMVDPEGPGGFTRVGMQYRARQSNRLDYGFGLEAIGRASPRSTGYLHQAYGQVRYGWFQLKAGRWEQTVGYVDTTLTAGSMMWSANATPVPRLTLEVPDFTPIPGFFGLLAFKGKFSHGWLEEDRYVPGTMVHEKYLYLRGLGRDGFPFLGHVGLIHNVMWGGTHPRFGELPGGLGSFIDAVLAQPASGDAPRGEVVNRLGNTIAAYHFGFTVNLPAYRFLAYRQVYIETGPALRFRNPWDGMWGASLRRRQPGRLVDGILWEHTFTRKQSSGGELFEQPTLRGNDQYYNNGVYQSGWTYHGRTIGLPLLVSNGTEQFPVFNNDLVAHHLGVEGMLPGQIAYRGLFTYSRNYGTRAAKLDRLIQRSALLELQGPLPFLSGLAFKGALAIDRGSLYPDSVGGLLGLIYRGGS